MAVNHRGDSAPTASRAVAQSFCEKMKTLLLEVRSFTLPAADMTSAFRGRRRAARLRSDRLQHWQSTAGLTKLVYLAI